MTTTAERIHAELARRGEDRGPLPGLPGAVPVPIERRGDDVNRGVEAFPAVPPGCAAFMMKGAELEGKQPGDLAVSLGVRA